MTMFVQLLVFTCACALGAADEVPPYKSIVDAILEAHRILRVNVVSMDGDVPHLNDHRRHYAEIIHVIHDEAQNEGSCLYHDYYEDYQTNINESAPFAIAHPQRVVDGTKKVIDDITKSIYEVLQLVNASANNGNQGSDKAIDEEINKNVEKHGWSRNVLLATGIVATQLNQNHKDYFAPSSQNRSAHNFVVNGAQRLEKNVEALTNLYKLLYKHFGTC